MLKHTYKADIIALCGFRVYWRVGGRRGVGGRGVGGGEEEGGSTNLGKFP